MANLLYIPVERRLFDAAAADNIYTQMLKVLQPYHVTVPEHNLGTPEEMGNFMTRVNQQHFDGIIFHNTSFTGAEFIEQIADYFPTTPILLIASREPSIGGWLRLNGATGLISTANSLMRRHHPYSYIYGDPDETKVQYKVKDFCQSVSLKAKLAQLKIGVVGTYPVGFAFAGANEAALKRTFGTELLHYEVDTAFADATALPETAYAGELAYAQAHMRHLDPELPETIKYVKFVALMRQWRQRDGFNALASRCWPDFFDKYAAAPGAVWSQLCDEGLPTAMECDIHGALAMYILQQMAGTDTPVYLGDISSFEPSDNTISVWHDYGPFALANPKYGVETSVHPNRKMLVSPQFVLKPGRVTLLRVHVNAAGAYELVTLGGTAQDAPAQFDGVSGRIRLDTPVAKVFDDIVRNGYEQHYALVYGDFTATVAQLGALLQLPIHTY
ncbi:hypothetical protein [Loigolactobacillus binensis]|uniref:L-fucose isomerase C-terminal domain-containing protein n=1 Tax=Loigolactobacillus binensis TaxID=2559922 RepID=A0ABW3EBG6_9LACO|nr:hypothetical protein [Loigolactobacillus binensis]